MTGFPAFSRAAWGRLLVAAETRTSQPVEVILGPRRTAELSRVRFAVCWVAVHELGASAHAVAKLLGSRHHTTILSALRRAEALRDTDPAFRALTDRLVAAGEAPDA